MKATYPCRPKRIGTYLFLILISFFFLLPLYVLIDTALKSFSEVSVTNMWALPTHPTLEPFKIAFLKLAPNLLNSFILTIPATLVSSLLGSITGYVLCKWKFRGANLIFILILFGMFIPYQSVLIPLVQLLSELRLYSTRIGLILVHIIYGLPLTTLIFRNYYTEIPDELLEASYLDGLGIIGIYRKIIFPVSIPAFVVVIIMQFTSIWNEFLFAITVTPDPSMQPVTVALQNMAGSQIVEWNVQMAGALLVALPTLLVYIFLGKYLIRGILSGSVKG